MVIFAAARRPISDGGRLLSYGDITLWDTVPIGVVRRLTFSAEVLNGVIQKVGYVSQPRDGV